MSTEPRKTPYLAICALLVVQYPLYSFAPSPNPSLLFRLFDALKPLPRLSCYHASSRLVTPFCSSALSRLLGVSLATRHLTGQLIIRHAPGHLVTWRAPSKTTSSYILGAGLIADRLPGYSAPSWFLGALLTAWCAPRNYPTANFQSSCNSQA